MINLTMRVFKITFWILLCISLGNARAQNTFSGIVTDSQGNPVPGATIVLNMHQYGTLANANGEFTFRNLGAGKYSLQVNQIGFDPFRDTILLNGNQQIKIALRPSVINLSEVVVRENYENARNRKEVLNIEVVRNSYIMQNNAGNLIKTIDKLPGVYSMDIGSGFSKPVIRGMGFNRVAVSENGIKQEGQQWGADHGLEVDLFNVDKMEIYKGPMSLRYGSDAIGGVIEIIPATIPVENKVFADAAFIYKSNNNMAGVSAMTGFRNGKWYGKVRFTEQHFGDYKIPADTIVYLTRALPVYNRRLKNTAGIERDVASTFGFTDSGFNTSFTISNVYQKTGFFPGSHGIPDLNRVQDDGDPNNIDKPASLVNHFKVINNTDIRIRQWKLAAKMAYQDNHRQELAKFHTHYGNQAPPEKDPDLELEFNLQTYTANISIESGESNAWKHIFGFNSDYQVNTIRGYNFLLPEYKRFTSGVFVTERVKVSDKFKITGGLRFDFGRLNIRAYKDSILGNYLYHMHIYSPQEVDFYSRRSYGINRDYNDVTYALGAIFTPTEKQTLKVNAGRSFRLPAANELASNGVHHGTFRHELGDTSLNSEKGYQLDVSYIYGEKRFYISLNPFVSWFSNYIFLEPTGEWSVLPHAGQIYNFNEASAFIGGGELTSSYKFLSNVTFETGFEYVYMQNLTDGYPLPFSPPLSVISSITWHSHKETRYGRLHGKLEHQYTGAQNRIARNEDRTPGYNLFHANLNYSVKIKKSILDVSFQVQNIFNTYYFNHLSYYRKLNIPEPGRNLQVIARYTFN